MMNGDKRKPLNAAHCIFSCKIHNCSFCFLLTRVFPLIFPRNRSSECVNNVMRDYRFLPIFSDQILFSLTYHIDFFNNSISTHFRMLEFLSINETTLIIFHFMSGLVYNNFDNSYFIELAQASNRRIVRLLDRHALYDGVSQVS